MSFVVSNREKSNFLWNSISGLLQRMLSIKVDDNAEALESEALCFLFQRWRHIYDFLLSISEFRSHQASSYRKCLSGEEIWDFYISTNVFWNTGMDENFINLIFNPLYLFSAAKLAYRRSLNHKETTVDMENWYFGVHSFFSRSLDIYPWF